jgi:HK97 family phage portal protein
VPSGLLKVRDPDLQPGSDDDPPGFVTARGIKKQWQASVRTGEVAVMSELVDFTPLSWTPSDAQMVEARQLSLVDVANLFNVDPYWVGSSQVSAPYQNVQDAAVQLSRFTLGFWITALEAQFSRLLPRGQEARFNRDSILRDPQSVRVDNWTKLLAAGVVSVDEVRASEGLPPAPTPEPALPVAGVTPLFPAGDSGTNQAQVGA